MKISVTVTLGLILLLMATGAWADDVKDGAPRTGLYLSLTGAAVWPFSVDTTSPSLSPGTIRTLWGGSFDGAIGYRYGDFRVEGDLMYGRSNADRIDYSGGGGDLTGYFKMWGMTLNCYYDFPTGRKYRPYIGAGLGGTRIEAHDVTLAGFPPTQGSNTVFTYKLMAGISYDLTAAWRLLLGYRFMGMGGQDYETGGIPLHGDPLKIHSVQAGVQYYF
ncbi:MAG: outer membrane beta-barrel protein [Syntrophales bacterium]|nr:outer membrane beta-barrel protein [Syntrophales bacterium]